METQHRKQHNAYTNHEVGLISKHWPTLMPMGELLALLPRHTENSITSYANKVLGLQRPTCRSAPGSPRKQPAWDRVRALLEQHPLTQVEIAGRCSFSRARASEILRAHPTDVYIKDWRWPETMGRAEAIWALGNEPDAPEPMGEQRARKSVVRRINPFAAALGLVEAPKGEPGRVYIHLTDSPYDELEAA